MNINEKLENNLINLRDCINDLITYNIAVTDMQIENFLKTFEKVRYNVLSEISIYNKTVEYEHEKIKTVDDEYKAEFVDNILKIYVPEMMPSYKNLKTQTYRRIANNVNEITKQFANLFEGGVFIYVKIYNDSLGWDIDNKCVKPIADALIASNVIKDDTIDKMFYCVKGEYSEQKPHSEIYVMNSEKIANFLQRFNTE